MMSDDVKEGQPVPADEDVAQSRKDEAVAPASSEQQKLRLDAERYLLQAEKLRLEAERERLVMEREKVERRLALLAGHDALIDLLKAAYADGGQEGLQAAVKARMSRIDVALFLRMAESAEAAATAAEREELVSLSQAIMRTIETADKAGAARLNEGIRESMSRAATSKGLLGATLSPTAPPPSQRELVERWVEATMANKNMTGGAAGAKGGPQPFSLGSFGNGTITSIPINLGGDGRGPGGLVLLPLWVPPTLLRYVSGAPTLQEEDIETLQKQVFGMDTFYVTATERSPLAVLFRGNLRGQNSAEVFGAVQARLQACPGLRDRVQLLLMPDFTPQTPEQMASGETNEPRPIFLAVSKDAQPKQPTSLTYALSFASVLASTFTAFAYALGTFALNPQFFEKINQGDIGVASQALPVALGIIALQLVHEVGHRLAALATAPKGASAGDKQNPLLGPPIFVPSLQVGSFGTITPFLTFPKDRKQMFDVSAAGPIAGALVSLATLVAGLVLTGGAPAEALANFPVVPAALFHSSAVIGAVTSFALPSAMLQALATPIPIHPLAIAGVTGVVVNALNLMPVGRLDGGRAACAVFGRRTAAVLGTLTLLLQAVSAIFNNYSLQLFWGLVVIIFQRGQDLPALDEVSEVDEGRNSALLLLLAFSLLTLLPFPTI